MPSLSRYLRPGNGVTKTIAGRDNVIECTGAQMSSVSIKINGDGNRLSIGVGSRLSGVTFHIEGNNHRITLGSDCVFDDGCSIWFEDSAGSLTVGDGSTFGSVHLAITEPGSKVTIGSDCMFANDIDVRTGDSHSIVSRTTGQRLNYAQDVVIGDHVWVAAHSILLKGVHIAADSIVATGAVVTGTFQAPGVVIAGNPAVVVKNEVAWKRERISR